MLKKRSITDIGCKSFIKRQNLHLKPRSELFKKILLVWFNGGEIGECRYYSLQGTRVLWRV